MSEYAASDARGPGENADLRVLVVTVVHHPLDSRIWFRQIHALLGAGCDVTFAAPFSGFRVPVPADRPAGGGRGALRCVDVPRSCGRHRVGAAIGARRLIREEAAEHDLVLVHDPELLFAVAGLGLANLVWDVHEDVAAALQVKRWMPRAVRPLAARLWRGVEGRVEDRYRLLLAESAYQLRFQRPHPVVPNTVTVPAHVDRPGRDRVVYVGSVTRPRGSRTMIEVGAELRRRTDGAVRLDIVGDAPDPVDAEELRQAHDRGDVVWHGYLPSDAALAVAGGALAGLCLLEDLPNFRLSMPTKVVEYCALGIPAVVTPLPLAVDLVRSADAGVVVPWHDPVAVADAVLTLRDDPERARRLGGNGYREALEHHDWRVWSQQFVATITSWAREGRAPVHRPLHDLVRAGDLRRTSPRSGATPRVRRRARVGAGLVRR